MKSAWRLAIEVSVLCFICIFWCEYGYYSYTLYSKCDGWPEQKPNQEKLSRIMVVSDIHIMGMRKSVRPDKWRREWQMKQSFRASKELYRPDVIIFLGDLLDEGSFSYRDEFEQASRDFEEIFFDGSSSKSPRHIVLAGNHDVGDHDRILTFPFLLERFQSRFESTPSAELIKVNDLNLISINSMSLNNDTCPLCRQTMLDLRDIAKELSSSISRPIVLTHYPLYRPDDTVCDYPVRLSESVKRRNVEGVDVIHKYQSEFILNNLNPRLILSGHTHLDCNVRHKNHGPDVDELTISSYNHKYAEDKPSYLLISANSTHIFSNRCNLVDESIILITYLLTLITVIVRLLYLIVRKSSNRKITAHDSSKIL